jgi:predicted Zn-dependent peptidase
MLRIWRLGHDEMVQPTCQRSAFDGKRRRYFEQLLLNVSKAIRATKKIKRLEKDFEKAIADAYALVVPNAFSNKLENEGAEGLNAFTSKDQTAYMVSLPSNKFELLMALESERFLRPRLREMYREREVVAEERRMTVENRR